MQIITDRRNLHRIPELVRTLPKTMAYLQGALEGLNCTVFSPMDGCLCAFFDFGRDSAIAFRCDADALPIAEKTGLTFASEHDGQMHACGHDGHMAIVLELARRLHEKAYLPHNVLLVFQPAEEEGAGARDVCNTGVFEEYKVQAIFGLHLWPSVKKGVIASRKGELFAHSCEINLDVWGESAHIAKSREHVDATAAAVEFYSRVRKMEQALPEHVYRILNFGLFQSGTACNAISGHARLSGSLRAYQDEIFQPLYQGVIATAKAVEKETGCRFDLKLNDGYPAVINPPALYDRVKDITDFTDLPAPYMTAEDFSWYQKRLPGMFFVLGVGDTPPLHAENFNFDENILLKGADFFEYLAEHFA